MVRNELLPYMATKLQHIHTNPIKNTARNAKFCVLHDLQSIKNGFRVKAFTHTKLDISLIFSSHFNHTPIFHQSINVVRNIPCHWIYVGHKAIQITLVSLNTCARQRLTTTTKSVVWSMETKYFREWVHAFKSTWNPMLTVFSFVFDCWLLCCLAAANPLTMANRTHAYEPSTKHPSRTLPFHWHGLNDKCK